MIDPTTMRRRDAFTVVELLVVIGIIGVLIAILLPALERAREQARIVKCASNERQIYMAMVMYAQSNAGVLPIPADSPPYFPFLAVYMDATGVYSYTRGALLPYLPGGASSRQQLFLCPSDGPDRFAGLDPEQTQPDPNRPRNFSYCFNTHLLGQRTGPVMTEDRGPIPGWSGIKLARIARADHKLLVVEPRYPRGPDEIMVSGNPSGGPPPILVSLTGRHLGRGNQCFADGHVELFDPSLLLTSPTDQSYTTLIPTEGGYVP